MPTLKIDGQEVTVPPGTTILKAAQQIGVEIPTFCYHPGLSIAANCRMCLVTMPPDKSGRTPKPLPACHAECRDGMEINSSTEEVQGLRQAVLEFILLNHPVDCPICDQAGECVLQDNYKDHSLKGSRLFTRKVHKAKVKPLGKSVVLDAERCILCTRCVRFCDEVTKTGEIRVSNRGEHSEITTFPDVPLDNDYSLNVVDICPVGALTSTDFRFKRRVWMLQGTRSVCDGCERGCNIRVDRFENKVERYVPMFHPTVNEWWLCDEGRLSFREQQGEDMLHRAPVIGGASEGITTQQAADRVGEALSGASGKSAIVLSGCLPCEDNWAAIELANAIGAKLYVGGREQRGENDDLLIRANKNPNARGVSALLAGKQAGGLNGLVSAIDAGEVTTALFLGSEHSLHAGAKEALAKLDTLAVIGSRVTELSQLASVLLPAAAGTARQGTFINFEGRVQRVRRATRLDPAGVVFPHWRILKRIALTAGHSWDWGSEESVFGAIADANQEFRGMTYAGLGDYGLMLGSGGESDIAQDAAERMIDHCAPQYRRDNVGSRQPWQH